MHTSLALRGRVVGDGSVLLGWHRRRGLRCRLALGLQPSHRNRSPRVCADACFSRLQVFTHARRADIIDQMIEETADPDDALLGTAERRSMVRAARASVCLQLGRVRAVKKLRPN